MLKADDALRLLERLNQAVQQDPIEAAVRDADAMLVMLVEGVHGSLQVVRQPGSINPECLSTSAPMQDYHQLDIWHRAMAFAVQVYQFSGMLPTDERYNLVTQLRRAAVSVPLNIAEDNQISRMVHAFIQRFGSPPTGGPDLGAHDS